MKGDIEKTRNVVAEIFGSIDSAPDCSCYPLSRWCLPRLLLRP
jgi:hypothetical protein